MFYNVLVKMDYCPMQPTFFFKYKGIGYIKIVFLYIDKKIMYIFILFT